MPTASALPTRTHRVLIVEDEQRLRELLAEMLPQMGFPATAARSGEEAMRLMESSPFDVILLDLQLPGIGGMDFFEQIHQRWPRTQVIVMTGFGDLPAARQAIRLDVVDFLTKPCPLGEIELSLERARRRLQSIDRPLHSESAEIEPPDPTETTTLWEVERQQILAALQRNDGNRTATATELGISRRTLHYRLREYRKLGLI
ncbi:MAG TPA: response regulator [Tepidisphaeraceae bacterium]|nr:response regulator [Tepidisphaeraceae bacterium]